MTLQASTSIGLRLNHLRVDAEGHLRTLVPLKEADRALKREFGRGEHERGDSYTDLKERIAEQLYKADLAEERVVQRRIANLRADVRATVEAELEAEQAALADREADVAARETNLMCGSTRKTGSSSAINPARGTASVARAMTATSP